MPKALDLMGSNFAKAAKNRDLLLDEDLMMTMFDPLGKKILPFLTHLNFMFDEKKSSLAESRYINDEVFPFSLLKTELYFWARKDIVQSHSCSVLPSGI